MDKTKRIQQSALSSLNFAKQQLSQASKEDDGYSNLQKQAKEAQSSYDDAVSEATASQTKLKSISVKINNVLIAPFDGIVEVNDKKIRCTFNNPVLTRKAGFGIRVRI